MIKLTKNNSVLILNTSNYSESEKKFLYEMFMDNPSNNIWISESTYYRKGIIFNQGVNLCNLCLLDTQPLQQENNIYIIPYRHIPFNFDKNKNLEEIGLKILDYLLLSNIVYSRIFSL